MNKIIWLILIIIVLVVGLFVGYKFLNKILSCSNNECAILLGDGVKYTHDNIVYNIKYVGVHQAYNTDDQAIINVDGKDYYFFAPPDNTDLNYIILTDEQDNWLPINVALKEFQEKKVIIKIRERPTNLT